VPALAPVIEHRQQSIPFIVILVDRRGADLFWSDVRESGSSSVSGDQTYIRKVQAGGWSHRTFQQRAENTWEHTAREVAEETSRLADSVQPRVITVAGDVRMSEMLRKRLPAVVAELVREVPGGRSPDGSDQHREAEVQRWIRTAIAEDTVAVLRLFEQERGQHDRASDGAEETFEALREARVDTLLIHDDGNLDQAAFFAPDEPSLVSLDHRTLVALGRSSILSARRADVAIRACILTGAGIRVVPAAPTLNDGIGAILRW
jgi:release factor family 2